MNIFGREINNRFAIWISINVLIVIDIVLISIAMFSTLPIDIARDIRIFDLIVCIILLAQWVITLHMSKPKKLFLKQKSNWIDLIASIPFDTIFIVIFPHALILGYLRLLKLFRVVVLFKRFFNSIEMFLHRSSLDKIIVFVFFMIIVFTFLLTVFGSRHNLLNNFYFVIVTLTTVGYGDIAPRSFNDKIITIILIFVGIFVFSIITAAISSFLTEKLLKEDDEEIEGKLDNLQQDLDKLHEENEELKREIGELKELIKSK